MRKSASSIPTNIAEGCGRNTKLDIARFFDMAIASANELEYQFLLSKDLDYISQDQFLNLSEKVTEVTKKHFNKKRSQLAKARNSWLVARGSWLVAHCSSLTSTPTHPHHQKNHKN